VGRVFEVGNRGWPTIKCPEVGIDTSGEAPLSSFWRSPVTQPPSGVIVGHSNMDLDCFGSIALARLLFPGYVALVSRHVHPVARPLVTMYRHHLELTSTKEFRGRAVDHLVVVDTRSSDRIAEYLEVFEGSPGSIDVFDHHPHDSRDILGARFHESRLGSNTSFLGTLVMERGIAMSPDDATIALTGIYADTGNFTHDNVSPEDFEVAAFLRSAGASIKLVKTFLSPLREQFQVTMFHEVLNDLVRRKINGHALLLSYTEMDGPRQGLSAVVEKVFEVENPEAYFGVFWFKHNRSAVIISRNQKDTIELDRIMGAFGGGGHAKAASALLKDVDGPELFEKLCGYLEASLLPAVTARSLMSHPVHVVTDTMTLVQAAMFLEEVNHSGCPVVGEDGTMKGILTLRDIMKARKAEQMHAPVKGYMTRKVLHASPESTVREIEEILLFRNVGHLPILEEGRLVGIVTRTDYLDFRRQEKARAEAVRESLG